MIKFGCCIDMIEYNVVVELQFRLELQYLLAHKENIGMIMCSMMSTCEV